MRYELTDLKVFLAVAARRSLTGGAESVYMTPPSASYRLKHLEQAMGCALFERTSKGMVLTAAGMTVKSFAEQIMHNVERLESDISRHKIGVTGNIRLFANSSTLSGLTPLLGSYLSSHPNVDIDLVEELSENTVKAVAQGNADIGLIAGPINTQDLESIVYGEDELIFITPPHHPLLVGTHTTLAQAVSYDLVSVGRETSNFKYLLGCVQSMGLTPRVRVHAPSFDAVIKCVRDGVGIAMVPRSTAAHDLAVGHIGHVQLQEPWAIRKQQIVMRCARELPDYAIELTARIVAVNCPFPASNRTTP